MTEHDSAEWRNVQRIVLRSIPTAQLRDEWIRRNNGAMVDPVAARVIDQMSRDDLIALCRMRGLDAGPRVEERRIDLPGFSIDMTGHVATWHGRTTRVGWRQAQVLYVLADAWRSGHPLVTTEWIAQKVWRGRDRGEAMNVARGHLQRLRFVFPGLIRDVALGAANSHTSRGLALDDAENRGAA